MIYRWAQTSPEQIIEQYASLLINSYSDISIRKYVIAIMIDCIEHTDALSDDSKVSLSKFYSVSFDGKNLENELITQILQLLKLMLSKGIYCNFVESQLHY